jgi:hypothetical protein
MAALFPGSVPQQADGVRIIINPDVIRPDPVRVEYGAPLCFPPDPCRKVGGTPPDDG